MISITRYCHIRNLEIRSNGEEIFKKETGNLNQFLEEAYGFLKLDYPKFYKMDTLCKLGYLASEVILNDGNINGNEAGVVLSNAASSLDTDIRFAKSMKTAASPALFVYTLPNIVAREICIRHQLKGENAFFISSDFDPELMFIHLEGLFRHGRVSSVIGGWVEVLGEQHDVFLYLAENRKVAQGQIELTAENLKKLYNS